MAILHRSSCLHFTLHKWTTWTFNLYIYYTLDLYILSITYWKRPWFYHRLLNLRLLLAKKLYDLAQRCMPAYCMCGKNSRISQDSFWLALTGFITSFIILKTEEIATVTAKMLQISIHGQDYIIRKHSSKICSYQRYKLDTKMFSELHKW